MKVEKVEGVEDYESPLVVTYDVKGAIGSATAKRLVLPADIFQGRATASFPHEKWE